MEKNNQRMELVTVTLTYIYIYIIHYRPPIIYLIIDMYTPFKLNNRYVHVFTQKLFIIVNCHTFHFLIAMMWQVSILLISVTVSTVSYI